MPIKTILKDIFSVTRWEKSKDFKCALFIGMTVGKANPLITLLVGMQNGISPFRGEVGNV